MLGDQPLGSVPLGFVDEFIPPIPEGGAAKFPAPILQYHMHRYSRADSGHLDAYPAYRK